MIYLLNIKQKKRILSPTSDSQLTSMINLLYELKYCCAPVLCWFKCLACRYLANYNIRSVIHIGGNNINFKDVNDINVKRIAEDIINIGKKCQIIRYRN